MLMSKPKSLLTIFFVSAIASLPSYLACHFFDSPQLHGIFSADIFFLLLLLALPYGKILWKLPLIVFAAFFAFFSNSLDAYATAGAYIVVVFTSVVVPRTRCFLLLAYSVFALFFLLADVDNFFYSTFVLTLSDVWGLAKFYWWGIALFFLAPVAIIFLELLFAKKILYGEKRIEINHLTVFLTILVMLLLNFGINCLQKRQPILDFGIKKWFWQICTPGIIGQNPYLQEDIKSVFKLWPKEKNVLTNVSKPTVFVLVESYGVNKSIPYTEALLSPFANTKASFIGLYPRESSHTQGAEWEDFGALGGKIYNKPIPQMFKENNMQTWFLHGYDGSFYKREKNYRQFGFDSLLFREELKRRNLDYCHYGFEGICDSAMISFIDSLLTDSIPKFVYWTTLDAHPPFESVTLSKNSPYCEKLSMSKVDCTYFTLQENTMLRLAALASNHPEYHFVIRGDHRPMGSLEQSDFVQRFYFRWVPLIILN